MPDKKAESPLVRELTDAFFAIKTNHQFEVTFMDQAMREYDICKAARAEGEAIGQAKGEAIGQARGEAIGQARGNIQGRQEVLSELISLGFLTQEQAEPYMHPAPDDSKAALTQ